MSLLHLFYIIIDVATDVRNRNSVFNIASIIVLHYLLNTLRINVAIVIIVVVLFLNYFGWQLRGLNLIWRSLNLAK